MFWLIPLAGAAAALFLSGCGDESEERPVPIIPDASPPPPEQDAGTDAYVPPTSDPFIKRISVGNGGVEGNKSSYSATLAGNGRYVTFVSEATNFFNNDKNLQPDVFVRDMVNGLTELINVRANGQVSYSGALNPSISQDGRFVAFTSDSGILDNSDTIDESLFLKDRQLGKTIKIAHGGASLGATDGSFGVISNDSGYVGYSSKFFPGSNGYEVAVYNTLKGSHELISVGFDGKDSSGSNFSIRPKVVGAGRWVVFESGAVNLVTGDNNILQDIFVRDKTLGTTERVNVGIGGAESNGTSGEPTISSDGALVAFSSEASNLVLNDTNGHKDIFVYNRSTKTMERISVSTNGEQGNGNSFSPRISNDGRFVAFSSDATNLIAAGDSNGKRDVFVHDRLNGITQRVSVGKGYAEANGSSDGWFSFSSDNKYLVFTSEASNLVLGDSNNASDVFMVSLEHFFNL